MSVPAGAAPLVSANIPPSFEEMFSSLLLMLMFPPASVFVAPA